MKRIKSTFPESDQIKHTKCNMVHGPEVRDIVELRGMRKEKAEKAGKRRILIFEDNPRSGGPKRRIRCEKV